MTVRDCCILAILSFSGLCLASDINGTLRPDQPLLVVIPAQLDQIQKPNLSSAFTSQFKRFSDLTPQRLELFVKTHPEFFRSVGNYLQDLYRGKYLSPEQFLALRRSTVDGLGQADLKVREKIPPVARYLKAQLEAEPSADIPKLITQGSEKIFDRSHVALRTDTVDQILSLSKVEQTGKQSELPRDNSDEDSVANVDAKYGKPHRASISLFGSNVSGHHHNVSMTPKRQPIRRMRTEGLRFEGYLPTDLDNLSVLLTLSGDRLHYDYGYPGSPIQKHESSGGVSFVYGRANIFNGQGQEVSFGLVRDHHTNNFISLDGRYGLGSGWSCTGSYYEQISTNRQTYEPSTGGWYKEDERSIAEFGLTKHLFEGIAVSTVYYENKMKATNGDSYELDGWRGELGYHF